MIAATLAELYPGAECELVHETPFQLLAATILSAQTTDVRVNSVAPALFAKYPDAPALAAANPAELEQIVHSTGFYQSKARNLILMAQALVERFDGEVPTDRDDLVTLAGVGRKTANVVRSVAFDLPGLPVDTHVGRLSRRLGLTATLVREDGKETDVFALIGPKRYDVPWKDLEHQGYEFESADGSLALLIRRMAEGRYYTFF